MNIKIHKMEPWLSKYADYKYNLSESGVENVTLKDIFQNAQIDYDKFFCTSLKDNDTLGSCQLRSQIASLYDNSTTKDQVLVTNGTSEAILLFFLLKNRPSVEVIVFDPVFQTLSEIPSYLGLVVKHIELKQENNFRINFSELESIIDKNKQTIIVINNPQNPTGMLLSNEDINQFCKIENKYENVEFLIDEHYRFINYYDNSVLPSLFDQFKKKTVVGSMIKCFGCVGLRIGWLVGEKNIVNACRNIKDYTTHSTNSGIDYISLQVLKSRDKYIEKYSKMICNNINIVEQLIDKNSDIISWVKPEGGIVCFPSFIKKVNVKRILSELAEKYKVVFLPGEYFGYYNSFRICLGIENLKFSEAMRLFDLFLKKYRDEGLI